MERTITIKYWWKCDNFKKGIPAELAEALEESAIERIAEMMKEGYVEGDLNDCVNLDVPGRRTPKDGYPCTGYWQVKKEEN
jgi:hypothetical protein